MTTDEKKEQVSAAVELKSLAIAVEELLTNQKKFFKTRDSKVLLECRKEEDRIAKWCNDIIRPDTQTKMF